MHEDLDCVVSAASAAACALFASWRHSHSSSPTSCNATTPFSVSFMSRVAPFRNIPNETPGTLCGCKISCAQLQSQQARSRRRRSLTVIIQILCRGKPHVLHRRKVGNKPKELEIGEAINSDLRVVRARIDTELATKILLLHPTSFEVQEQIYPRVGALLFIPPSSIVGIGGERGGRSMSRPMCDETCRQRVRSSVCK